MKKDGTKDDKNVDKERWTISQTEIESYLRNWGDPRIIWPDSY